MRRKKNKSGKNKAHSEGMLAQALGIQNPYDEFSKKGGEFWKGTKQTLPRKIEGLK